MSKRHVKFGILLLVFANVGMMVSPVSADVVPRGSGGSEWSECTVALDLSRYSDAAVSFNFASLMHHNPSAFRLSSAKGMSYLDGFRLLSPVRSRAVRTGSGAVSRAEGGHFEYSGGGGGPQLRYGDVQSRGVRRTICHP